MIAIKRRRRDPTLQSRRSPELLPAGVAAAGAGPAGHPGEGQLSEQAAGKRASLPGCAPWPREPALGICGSAADLLFGL